MLCDDKSARVESHHHACRINVAALVIAAPGVLSCRNGYVRRVSSLAVLCPVCARNKNCVAGIIQPCPVSVTASHTEKLRQTIINRAQHFGLRRYPRKDIRAVRSSDKNRESVSCDLPRTRDEALLYIPLCAGCRDDALRQQKS